MNDDESRILWNWSRPPLFAQPFDPRQPFNAERYRTEPPLWKHTFTDLGRILDQLHQTPLGIHDESRQKYWPDSPSGEWYYDASMRITVLRAIDLKQHFTRFHPILFRHTVMLIQLEHGPDLDVSPLVTVVGGQYWCDGAISFVGEGNPALAIVLKFQPTAG